VVVVVSGFDEVVLTTGDVFVLVVVVDETGFGEVVVVVSWQFMTRTVFKINTNNNDVFIFKFLNKNNSYFL